MDFGLALLVIPVIIGVVVACVRLGLPPAYEAPLAMLVGLVIFVGYAVAAHVPGGGAVFEGALRGLAIGLSAAGVIATIRRLVEDRHARKGR